MPSKNQVIIMGHLGRDAEIRYSADGKPIATFSAAATTGKEPYKHTEWFQVVAFGYLAEPTGQLKKGDGVYVEGELRTRSWEDREGETQYRTEVRAWKIEKIERRRDTEP